jgi:glycosyltransferase involved in cell wall biosynthesis
VIDGVEVQRVLGFRVAQLQYEEIRVAPGMLLALNRKDVDIVHCQGCYHFVLWLSLLTSKPTVITTHSDMTFTGHSLGSEFRNFPLRHCTKVLAITQREKRNLKLRGVDDEKIVVIPNGVTLPPRNAPLRDLGTTIFCLSRLDLYTKGQDVVIRAMPKVLARIPDAQLVIAGTGKDLLRLKRLTAQLQVEKNVTFIGEISEVTKALYLKNSTVFCQPSRVEAFGVVFLEAMAYGLPVITSRIGGIPEVMGDAGILVPPNDPIAVSHALLRVLTNHAFAGKLQTQSLERVKGFDWNAITRRYEKLYDALI